MGIVVLQWKVKEKRGKWWQTGKKNGKSEKGRQEVKDDLRAGLRVQAKHEEPRRALEKREAVQCSEWEQMCVTLLKLEKWQVYILMVHSISLH